MNKSDPPKKRPLWGIRRPSQAYSFGDLIPVPEVTELDTDTDTAWGLFEELAEPGTKPKSTPVPFAETVPADLEPMVESPKPAPRRN